MEIYEKFSIRRKKKIYGNQLQTGWGPQELQSDHIIQIYSSTDEDTGFPRLCWVSKRTRLPMQDTKETGDPRLGKIP